MRSLAAKKDFFLVSIIGILFGVFAIPILENIKPAFWHLNIASVSILIGGFLIFANLDLWFAGLIGSKIPSLWQFAKYAASGALSSLIDVGIFNLLSKIFQVFSGPPIILFTILSFSAAVINGYLWNRLWTFKKEGASPEVSEFAKFLAVTLIGLLINTAIVYFVTTILGAPKNISGELWENIAKLIALLPTITWNFIGYKLIVFKQ